MMISGRMGVPGERMNDQNGIVPGLIQFAIGLVGKSNGSQGSPALQGHLVGRRGKREVLGFNDSDRPGSIHIVLFLSVARPRGRISSSSALLLRSVQGLIEISDDVPHV